MKNVHHDWAVLSRGRRLALRGDAIPDRAGRDGHSYRFVPRAESSLRSTRRSSCRYSRARHPATTALATAGRGQQGTGNCHGWHSVSSGPATGQTTAMCACRGPRFWRTERGSQGGRASGRTLESSGLRIPARSRSLAWTRLSCHLPFAPHHTFCSVVAWPA